MTLAGGRKFKEPEIHVVSTLGDASKAERGRRAEPLDEYLAWLAARSTRFEREDARQKATGCQFLAGLYRKRFGSSVAALRATLRRRLDLPPATRTPTGPFPSWTTDASDPEDEVIDPGAEAETPPPPLSPRRGRWLGASSTPPRAVPSGSDSKLQALVKLLAGAVAGQKVVVFTEYRDTLRAARSSARDARASRT